MGEAITVRELSVYYGRFRAVADVNVDIAANRVTALIGPSGTGKSSLLRAMNRLHEVPAGRRVEGQVLLDGQDIYGPRVDLNRVRRLIGMIFQVPNPFPTMSIYQNVVAGHLLAREHLPRATLDEIVETSLTRTNLWAEVKDRLRQPGSSLSGGQQQRLCIARAIAMRPEVLLMDEPASALDPISTYILEDLIQQLARTVTIVIVTHNMQQAARVSHTTAFLDLAGPGEPGRLIEVDTTDHIFTNPSNSRTTDYITGRFG